MGQLHSVHNALLSFSTSSLGFIYRVIFDRNKTAKQEKFNLPAATLPKATPQSLPVELLHIFSFMELKPYIISRGVCRDWLHLLPLADIHPIRRRLFQLFQTMINTPGFPETRTWIVENLRPFDRHAYIDSLLAQYPAIPEEFRIWILEWPALLVIGNMWPALPFIRSRTCTAARRPGVNWMAYKNESPELLAVIYKQNTPEVKVIPGLLIWRVTSSTDWLLFDNDEPGLFGRVFVIDFLELEASAVIPHKQRSKYTSDTPEPQLEGAGSSVEESGENRRDGSMQADGEDSDDFISNVPYPDWISYLEYRWTVTVKYIPGCTFLSLSDGVIRTPCVTCFNECQESTLPTFPWNVRHTLTGYLMTS